MNNEIKCPSCGTNTKLMVERRPNGNATCKYCDWSGPSKDCFPDTEGKLLAHIAKLEAQNKRLVEALRCIALNDIVNFPGALAHNTLKDLD